MKKTFGTIIALLLFFSSSAALAKVKTPPAEVVSINSPQLKRYADGSDKFIVPITIRNNTWDWLKGLNYKLYIFDKKGKMVYETSKEKSSIGHRREEQAMFWKAGKLKGGVTVYQAIILPKTFKKTYGNPEICVIEVLVNGKIVSVNSRPQSFFKYKGASKREKRIAEWRKIKKGFWNR